MFCIIHFKIISRWVDFIANIAYKHIKIAYKHIKILLTIKKTIMGWVEISKQDFKMWAKITNFMGTSKTTTITIFFTSHHLPPNSLWTARPSLTSFCLVWISCANMGVYVCTKLGFSGILEMCQEKEGSVRCIFFSIFDGFHPWL